MLNKENLSKLRTNYENNKTNKIRQRVVNKVQLVDLIQDSDTSLNYEFNINIKTHGITDQKSTGTLLGFCWIKYSKRKSNRKM